eukprot:5472818-Pyramimonas_sp.AAC.1
MRALNSAVEVLVRRRECEGFGIAYLQTSLNSALRSDYPYVEESPPCMMWVAHSIVAPSRTGYAPRIDNGPQTTSAGRWCNLEVRDDPRP